MDEKPKNTNFEEKATDDAWTEMENGSLWDLKFSNELKIETLMIQLVVR